MIIAVDGPSGTGKSTIAQTLASMLGFSYFNTGAMYRAFAFFLLDSKVDFDNDDEIMNALKSFTFTFDSCGKDIYYKVGGKDVTGEIFKDKISLAASKSSKKSFVRKSLLEVQKDFAKKTNVIFEGRDIGTVVFPEAEVKFFLTADVEIRAKRRLGQLKEKYPGQANSFDFEEVLADMKKRDERDETRKIAPLKPAKDAVLVDTSKLTIEQVVQEMLKHPELERVKS